MNDKRLIEDWLPIDKIGVESDRERGASSALPPIYYLHTWWARRPLVISRAAVLASILPDDADHGKFLHVLGIHGDPVETRRLIDQAVKAGTRYKKGYGYDRSFKYVLEKDDVDWLLDNSVHDQTVVDPTGGGGSIPFEAMRLGTNVSTNDLNPVSVLIMRATLSWPVLFGNNVALEFIQLVSRLLVKLKEKLKIFFTHEKTNDNIPITFLWARTIPCPHCSGMVPLSPHWRIAPDDTGVRIVPYESDGPGSTGRICTFQIVDSIKEQSEGTVSRGNGICPYPDCRRAISGDDIKETARSGNMGEQLYAVAYKKQITTRTKTGKLRKKWVKQYRKPELQDYNAESIQTELEEKLQEWDVFDTVPGENIPMGNKTTELLRYGMQKWRDLFSPRQLLCHGTSVEVFHDILDEDRKNNNLTDIRKAAYGYLAIALDAAITYNSRLSTWDSSSNRGVRNSFPRHDYGFKWSFAEMAPLVTGLGYEWAFNKTLDSLKELISLIGSSQNAKLDDDVASPVKREPIITCKSADNLDHIQDGIVDVIVMDPPYYDNVMYAELSDFFYVWLKRTAGLIFPELFKLNLTDKENEAVANPAKFAGQKGALAMAHQDYENRMALIFEECKRILKPSGIMTIMFMHKSTGAWDAVSKGIIKAGFYITASWPINSEARSSLHIRDKAAAKSTILLTCRPRKDDDTISYWEDVEPNVRKLVHDKINDFEEVGMRGIDIYLSAFGPALEEFSRNWPMKRVSPRRGAKGDSRYTVTPEDALMTARREVKRWRLDKLISSTPNKDLDAITAFFVLAWDTFKAPKFPYDEALHLARAVNVDLDKDIMRKVAKKSGENMFILSSQDRWSRTHRVPDGASAMIDVLHYVAYTGQKEGADAAIKYIESEHFDENESFIAALEAVLNVLPAPSSRPQTLKGALKSASSDYDALYNVYRLKFKGEIDDPGQSLLI